MNLVNAQAIARLKDRTLLINRFLLVLGVCLPEHEPIAYWTLKGFFHWILPPFSRRLHIFSKIHIFVRTCLSRLKIYSFSTMYFVPLFISKKFNLNRLKVLVSQIHFIGSTISKLSVSNFLKSWWCFWRVQNSKSDIFYFEGSQHFYDFFFE